MRTGRGRAVGELPEWLARERTAEWERTVKEAAEKGYFPIMCIDGPRKGRQYIWPKGTCIFQVITLRPGSVEDAYNGGRVSGYGAALYRVCSMWGTRQPVGCFSHWGYK